MKYVFSALFILILVFGAFGQKRPVKKDGNLQTAINQYTTEIVASLKNTGGMNAYAVSNKNTFLSDVDNDGDFDAVVEVFFCEKTSCHPTTQSSKLAIFIKDKQTYKMVADKSFTLYGKINSVDKNKIVLDIYDLDEDDPQCCPEIAHL